MFARLNERGQAIVEYILLLIVSVALLVGLGTALFAPLRDFLQAYMGSYVACLLETGELPSLGSADASKSLSDEGCNARYQPGTLKAGRPPINSGSQSSSSSSKDSSSSNSGANGSSSSADSNSGKDSASSNGSSSATASQRRNFNSSNKGLDGSAKANDKVTDIPVAESAQSSFYNRQGAWGNQSIGGGKKSVAIGLAGMTEDEKKKMQRKENSSRAIASGDAIASAPKKISIKKPEPKPVEAVDEPMTFGVFLKFLLIAGIVIALIVVLGGQALKISKSRD